MDHTLPALEGISIISLVGGYPLTIRGFLVYAVYQQRRPATTAAKAEAGAAAAATVVTARVLTTLGPRG